MDGGRRRRIGLDRRSTTGAVGVALSASLALAIALPSATAARAPGARPPAPIGAAHPRLLRFGWPVAPFHRPHPIRASFGEPRGLLGLGLGLRGNERALALRGLDQIAPAGQRVLHTGVDIVAADLTPVYAVRSGIAHTSGRGYGRHVVVGRFGYWHLIDAVPTGTHVVAFRTVIGRVFPGQEHIHLTRYGRGLRPVNPLVAGGLTPYRDTAPPQLGPLRAFDASGRQVALSALSGPVLLAVHAYDVKSDGGLHTGIYRLWYTLFRWRSHRPLVGPVAVLRFDTLPAPAKAGALYTLASTRHGLCTRFWYLLSARTPSGDGYLHAEGLAPGRYRLVVRAFDERGNSARRAYLLTVVPGADGAATHPLLPRPASRRAEHLRCAALG